MGKCEEMEPVKNFAICFQVAIVATHAIRETQVAKGNGNYSRDLYPFREIIDACLDEAKNTEETIAVIDKAMKEHRDYAKV